VKLTRYQRDVLRDIASGSAAVLTISRTTGNSSVDWFPSPPRAGHVSPPRRPTLDRLLQDGLLSRKPHPVGDATDVAWLYTLSAAGRDLLGKEAVS
jgi:hypothetical protein